MRFGINLRGDLAKLSDRELSDRLEAAWASHDEAQKKQRGKLWYSRRGIFRHPWFYRLFSVAGMNTPGFGGYFGLGPFFRVDAGEQHLALCEIRDLTDEAERRVRERRTSS